MHELSLTEQTVTVQICPTEKVASMDEVHHVLEGAACHGNWLRLARMTLEVCRAWRRLRRRHSLLSASTRRNWNVCPSAAGRSRMLVSRCGLVYRSQRRRATQHHLLHTFLASTRMSMWGWTVRLCTTVVAVIWTSSARRIPTWTACSCRPCLHWWHLLESRMPLSSGQIWKPHSRIHFMLCTCTRDRARATSHATKTLEDEIREEVLRTWFRGPTPKCTLSSSPSSRQSSAAAWVAWRLMRTEIRRTEIPCQFVASTPQARWRMTFTATVAWEEILPWVVWRSASVKYTSGGKAKLTSLAQLSSGGLSGKLQVGWLNGPCLASSLTSWRSKCNPCHGGECTACRLMCRSDMVLKDVDTAVATTKAKHTIQFEDWSPAGFKVGYDYQLSKVVTVREKCIRLFKNVLVCCSWFQIVSCRCVGMCFDCLCCLRSFWIVLVGKLFSSVIGCARLCEAVLIQSCVGSFGCFR